MGGIQLLGRRARGLISSLAFQSNLRRCGEPVEKAGACVEPRHALFSKKRARRHQLSGAFERANVEVRLAGSFGLLQVSVEPQRAQKPRSTPGEDSCFAIMPLVSETASSAKATNTEAGAPLWRLQLWQ
jgi:hypothetical protein